MANNVLQPDREYRTPASTMPGYLNESPSGFSYSWSATPERPVAQLDGTALALATGMPLRYGAEMVHCVDLYSSQLYHVLPILHEAHIRGLLAFPSKLSIAERAFFLTFCAVAKLRDYR